MVRSSRLAVLCAIAASLSLHAQTTLDPATIVSMFHTYAAGDVEVVARTLVTRDSFPREVRNDRNDPLLPWTNALRKEWRGDWQPVQPVFLLELAIAASTIQIDPRGVGTLDRMTKSFLAAGAQRLIERHSKIGTNPGDDRFEATWHKAAVGVLEGLPAKLPKAETPAFIAAYLSDVEKRYHSAKLHDLDGWIALARGVAAAPRRQELVSPGRHDPYTTLDNRLSEVDIATQLLEKAARYLDVHDEAGIRRGFLLLNAHRADEGLRALADVADNPGDSDRTYWAHLVRAQLLDAKGRFDDAAQEYRAALSVTPRTQGAGLGLALDLMRTGRRADADDVATDTITAPSNVRDPWWTFDSADARFVPGWLAELRRSGR